MSYIMNDSKSTFVPKVDERQELVNNCYQINRNYNSIQESSHGLNDKLMTNYETVDKTVNEMESTGSHVSQFRDTIFEEFKKDGIIKTMDKKKEKEEIYYCFYCDKYLMSLICLKSHVSSVDHQKLKGSTSLADEKGLNKKFVMPSKSKTEPTLELAQILRRELDRIPIQLKHYYQRNEIRLMDGIGTNAYYCKMCRQSIQSFQLIESHLISESHQKFGKRKTLLQFIYDSKNSEPVIGLQYIIEYNNTSLPNLLYECTLCDNIGNSQLMYSHIISFDHRFKLLKYIDKDFDVNSSELMIANRIKVLQQSVGMGFLIKTNKPSNSRTNKKFRRKLMKKQFNSSEKTVEPNSGKFAQKQETSHSDSKGNDYQMKRDDKQQNNCVFKSNVEIRDSIHKEYKTDYIIVTYDQKNNKEFYYCYYCHFYMSENDAIERHITTSQHINNVLNGISYDRGLNKEFVMDSISDKMPENYHKLKERELDRYPLELKHFYFKEGIRIMDVIGPNAYYCKFCEKSIPSFSSIETHLLSHRSTKQSFTLTELINESKHSIPIVGLQYITENTIPEFERPVYKCNLCNCFQNAQQMYSHITSFEHSIKLLRINNIEIQDFSEQMVENYIKILHQKLGSGRLKKIENLITNSPQKHNSLSTSDKPQKPFYFSDTEEIVEISDSLPKQESILESHSKQTQISNKNEDILLPGFEKEGIIQTLDISNKRIFYCFYCDSYLHNYENSVENHIKKVTHRKIRINGLSYSEGLNKRFLMKTIDSNASQNEIIEEIKRKALDSIPIVSKYYYYKNGIKLMDGKGSNAYFCRFCQKCLPSLESIDVHLLSESHVQIDKRPKKFRHFLNKTNEPIIGLKYVKEHISPSKEPHYECTLCNYFSDCHKMCLHVLSFKHRLELLKRMSPNHVFLESSENSSVTFDSIQLLKHEIRKLEEEFGCSYMTKVEDSNNRLLDQFESNSYERLNNNCNSGQSSASKKPRIGHSFTKLETQELSDDMSSLEKLFSVKLFNDDEVSKAVAIIESLKNAVINYYTNKVSPQMRPLLMNQIKGNNDNYEVCSMDTSL